MRAMKKETHLTWSDFDPHPNLMVFTSSGAKFRQQKKARLQQREKMARSMKHFLQESQVSNTETIEGEEITVSKAAPSPSSATCEPSTSTSIENLASVESAILTTTTTSDTFDDEASNEVETDITSIVPSEDPGLWPRSITNDVRILVDRGPPLIGRFKRLTLEFCQRIEDSIQSFDFLDICQ
ncbi:uncharacterized protein LOC123685064 [Harmonia axyridis]|uniref:uncharacterized protein LOC123685064 n=1 Tax=Harmonia axyridis TaxID=115357 RepID=UPI001E277F83|nr:uncharacterized protein LOC123685064 [Harmonia axyridis]